MTANEDGEYDDVMSTDLLVIAGTAAEMLERDGYIACGRRQDGVTRVDFWTPDGMSYRYELGSNATTPEEVVAACHALTGDPTERPVPRRVSPLN